MFMVEQKRAPIEREGKWDAKKDAKKVGAHWLSLTEEERGVYVRLFEEALGECDAMQGMYEEALQQWRQGKRDRGVGEGDGAGARVCNCTYCTG